MKLKVFSCSIHGTTDALRCNTCSDYRSKGEIQELLKANEANREKQKGLRGVVWSYGVTTVPSRRKSLLPLTLRSLREGGFPNPHLFVDGDPDGRGWEQEFGLTVTCRSPRVRTHGNWVLSFYELFVREPNAQRFAVFQDDFVCYRNLRQYLEKCSYPERGYWNLYTFPENESTAPLASLGDRDPGVGFFPSNQKGRGAVALVFSREALLVLLAQEHMLHRPLDCHRGWRAVDGGIVTAMGKAGWKEYVHYPSLVQHTGRESSMNNPEHLQSRSFRGGGYDALDLLEKK